MRGRPERDKSFQNKLTIILEVFKIMSKQDLAAIAKAMVAPGKGLLAMDESNRTCNKRFEDVGIAPTQENRRAYRELILTTPGLGTSISGAILYDETIRQAKKDGTSFIKLMIDIGITRHMQAHAYCGLESS